MNGFAIFQHILSVYHTIPHGSIGVHTPDSAGPRSVRDGRPNSEDGALEMAAQNDTQKKRIWRVVGGSPLFHLGTPNLWHEGNKYLPIVHPVSTSSLLYR